MREQHSVAWGRCGLLGKFGVEVWGLSEDLEVMIRNLAGNYPTFTITCRGGQCPVHRVQVRGRFPFICPNPSTHHPTPIKNKRKARKMQWKICRWNFGISWPSIWIRLFLSSCDKWRAGIVLLALVVALLD